MSSPPLSTREVIWVAGALLAGLVPHMQRFPAFLSLAFVGAALWRVLNAERQCDVLLRDVRRALAEHVSDAATLNLSTDFAQALESATDWLLATGYGLRRLVFSRAGVGR